MCLPRLSCRTEGPRCRGRQRRSSATRVAPERTASEAPTAPRPNQWPFYCRAAGNGIFKEEETTAYNAARENEYTLYQLHLRCSSFANQIRGSQVADLHRKRIVSLMIIVAGNKSSCSLINYLFIILEGGRPDFVYIFRSLLSSDDFARSQNLYRAAADDQQN